MHELSIAQSIVETVCETARCEGTTQVLSIQLELGLLSGVIKEALEFCFPLASQSTCAENARLDIREIPAFASCPACSQSFELFEFLLVCPECGHFPVTVSSGDRLRIASVEIEDGTNGAVSENGRTGGAKA